MEIEMTLSDQFEKEAMLVQQEHEEDDRRSAGVILWILGTLLTACVAAAGVLAYLSVMP